jgi:hypothetical protein
MHKGEIYKRGQRGQKPTEMNKMAELLVLHNENPWLSKFLLEKVAGPGHWGKLYNAISEGKNLSTIGTHLGRGLASTPAVPGALIGGAVGAGTAQDGNRLQGAMLGAGGGAVGGYALGKIPGMTSNVARSGARQAQQGARQVQQGARQAQQGAQQGARQAQQGARQAQQAQQAQQGGRRAQQGAQQAQQGAQQAQQGAQQRVLNTQAVQGAPTVFDNSPLPYANTVAPGSFTAPPRSFTTPANSFVPAPTAGPLHAADPLQGMSRAPGGILSPQSAAPSPLPNVGFTPAQSVGPLHAADPLQGMSRAPGGILSPSYVPPQSPTPVLQQGANVSQASFLKTRPALQTAAAEPIAPPSSFVPSIEQPASLTMGPQSYQTLSLNQPQSSLQRITGGRTRSVSGPAQVGDHAIFQPTSTDRLMNTQAVQGTAPPMSLSPISQPYNPTTQVPSMSSGQIQGFSPPANPMSSGQIQGFGPPMADISPISSPGMMTLAPPSVGPAVVPAPQPGGRLNAKFIAQGGNPNANPNIVPVQAQTQPRRPLDDDLFT